MMAKMNDAEHPADYAPIHRPLNHKFLCCGYVLSRGGNFAVKARIRGTNKQAHLGTYVTEEEGGKVYACYQDYFAP